MKTTCLLFTLLAILAPSASAQQIFLGGNAPPRAEQEARRKKGFERELAVLISDMERTCKLSEAQVKKLKVAAKGAVAAAMETMKKRQAKARQGFAGGLGGGWVEEEEEAVEEAEEEEEEPNAEMANEVVNVFVANLSGTPGTGSWMVKQESRWTNAVNKIVTKEQRNQYAVVTKARLARARKAAVALFIAQVDKKLLLSDEQRKKLTSMVDEKFGAEMGKDVGPKNNGIFFVGRPGGGSDAPLDHTTLKSLFSEAQFTEWKQSYENELRQYSNRRVRAGAFGAAAVRAAPMVQEIRIGVQNAAEEPEDDK